MSKRLVWTMILMAVSLLLAACGGGDSAPPAATSLQPTNTVPAVADSGAAAGTEEQNGAAIEVVMNDIWFGDDWNNIEKPPTWTVKGGGQVSLQLRNVGALEHNWAVVKAGEEVPIPFSATDHAGKLLWDAGIVKGGEELMATFSAPEPGTYTIICTVAGHYPNMQGKLEVEN